MALTQEQKILSRQAVAIHSRLSCSPPRTQRRLPTTLWQRVLTIERHLQTAEANGWRAAAAILQTEFPVAIGSLMRDLARCQLDPTPSSSRPLLRDVYQDLVSLREEFEEPFAWNNESGVLTLTTAPITLEQVYLGPFRIHLRVEPCRAMDYDIEAVDPHPAARDDSITHPHVQSRTLCEGDGKHAIRAALAQGRLYDFFVLVRQVLHTYGAGSAYVTLDRWSGSACADCDQPFYRDDEADICVQCSAELCESCRNSCGECGDTVCSQCLSHCAVCDSSLCRSCAQRCRACSRRTCGACLQEDQRCEVCHEEDESRAPTSDTTDSTV